MFIRGLQRNPDRRSTSNAPFHECSGQKSAQGTELLDREDERLIVKYRQVDLLNLTKSIIFLTGFIFLISGFAVSETCAAPLGQELLKKASPDSDSSLHKLTRQVREYALLAEDTDDETVFWIYFSDKGLPTERDTYSALASVSDRYPDRTVSRRIKRGGGEPFDHLDLPVYAPYLDALVSVGVTHRATSRWLNAVSVTCAFDMLPAVVSFDFVDRVDLARPSARKPENRYPFKYGLFPDGRPDAGGKPAGGKGLEPQVRSIPVSPPDSSDYNYSYHQLQQLGIPAVHRFGINGSGVVICMLDTGYLRDHPAIAAQQVLAGGP